MPKRRLPVVNAAALAAQQGARGLPTTDIHQEPDFLAIDPDLPEDQLIVASRKNYRRMLRHTEKALFDIVKSPAEQAKDRIAAAKEINDQAGLPRKTESQKVLHDLPVEAIVSAFAALSTLADKGQLPALRNVTPGTDKAKEQ
jgi:hypothetical protein